MDPRELAIDADRARLQAMRLRAAALLRTLHRRRGCPRPGAEAQLVLSLRRSTRWARLKLVRLSFAAEWTVAAEEFDVVLGALDRHCLDLEAWMRREAG